MVKCPNCGGEVGEEYNFCKYCGITLSGFSPGESRVTSAAETEVGGVITKRFEGIKNRDENMVKAVFGEHYNKFDDWPPFQRQEMDEALRNEFNAFKVLSNYSYELKSLKVDVFGDVAVASFLIHYGGEIRNKRFKISSRVTSVLNRQNSQWKIVHEHFSRSLEALKR
ncbi:nuclear transport factor 2 family protein [Candidatus Bathyarchaeota archaeon]|nr:nuclear transport factor 2 family protein [Candidatus Bathyarchaeota archaeon]